MRSSGEWCARLVRVKSGVHEATPLECVPTDVHGAASQFASSSRCELLSVSKPRLREIFDEFPEVREHLANLVRVRLAKLQRLNPHPGSPPPAVRENSKTRETAATLTSRFAAKLSLPRCAASGLA